jgi:hypothetical protein
MKTTKLLMDNDLAYFQHLQEFNCRLRNLTFVAR